MNPLLNNGKTDIFWRDIQEDDSIFLEENRNRSILILTDVMNDPMFPRISFARYIDIRNCRDNSCEEYVRFYAFLTP